MSKKLIVVGGGLAGSEAAWQAAERGVEILLYEMRPQVPTAVHKTEHCAELVCSNSLGTNDSNKAPGLLKEELRQSGSLLIRIADAVRVPAGQALAVDRIRFAEEATRQLESHPRIRLMREEMKEIPADLCVLATGPLTSPSLAQSLTQYCGNYLYYYDAVSPIVTAESLDLTKLFRASRYHRGDDHAYLNAPFERQEYENFIRAIRESERAPYAPHEEPKFFEGCMPVEEMADRGPDTLRFGPMKPVGLADPRTHREAYAVIQLRQENEEATLYNLVGFQTRMAWGEQARVFRMIPGFEQAEFVRFGVMHRNIFVNAPTLLSPTMELKANPNVILAGQITGVEGYVEDIASGYLAGINAARKLNGMAPHIFPRATAIGALMHHITHADPGSFQPINVHFGLFPPLDEPIKDKLKRQQAILLRAKNELSAFLENILQSERALQL